LIADDDDILPEGMKNFEPDRDLDRAARVVDVLSVTTTMGKWAWISVIYVRSFRPTCRHSALIINNVSDVPDDVDKRFHSY
jgi:hypothetical protein